MRTGQSLDGLSGVGRKKGKDMSLADELFRIADSMEARGRILEEEFGKPLHQLTNAADEIGKAWSGSWLGYHSRVYYEGLVDPPPGARFSKEWGMMNISRIQVTVGHWKEYRFDDVIGSIEQAAGNPDITQQQEFSATISKEFEEAQSSILSLLSGILEDRHDDKYLNDISKKVEEIEILGASSFIEAMRPSGQIRSRDKLAIQAGLHTPPHISVLAQVLAIRYPSTACEKLSKLTRRAASHIQNIEKYKSQSERVGIDQDDAIALVPQRLTGLGPGIVELAGLTDHNGTGADNQNTLDVSSSGH